MRFSAILVFSTLLLASAAGSAAPVADPLGSASWGDMRKMFFGKARVVFDDRVKVVAPLTAENPLNVPIGVDASAIPGVKQVLVFVDSNPINEVLRFFPERGLAKLGFRVKLQQSYRFVPRRLPVTVSGMSAVSGSIRPVVAVPHRLLVPVRPSGSAA